MPRPFTPRLLLLLEPDAREPSDLPPAEDEDDKITFEDFCALLKLIRIENDLSQEQLGSILHVSQKTIHRWESGLRPAPLLARGILVAVDEYAPSWVAAISQAFEIPYPVRHERSPAPDEAVLAPPPPDAIVKAAFEGALFEASERLGVSSARVRDAMILLLERMALLKLDVEAAARIARGNANG